MQTAFISDIHGNLPALEAVLADIDRAHIETVVCLGDVIGYGPEPGACVRVVQERCFACVLGNHEAMLIYAGLEALEEMPPGVVLPLRLANEQLCESQKEWLRQMPLVANLNPITAVHGRLDHPERFQYIFSKSDARLNFKEQQHPVCVQGHSHVPLIWESRNGEVVRHDPVESPVYLEKDSQYIVNVGSVGQPRDDNPDACYVVYDFDHQSVQHRRISYNITITQSRIRDAGLPEGNALRIALGC